MEEKISLIFKMVSGINEKNLCCVNQIFDPNPFSLYIATELDHKLVILTDTLSLSVGIFCMVPLPKAAPTEPWHACTSGLLQL